MKLFAYLTTLLLLTSASAFAAQVNTKEEAINLAIKAIHKYQLTTLSDECGLIDTVEKESRFEIVVHERHNSSCGGDPETKPRLFSVYVRKRDGQLTSDVYDGTSYKLVNRKLSKPASK